MTTCEKCRFWDGDCCMRLLMLAMQDGLVCVPLSLESTAVAGCKWYRSAEVTQ